MMEGGTCHTLHQHSFSFLRLKTYPGLAGKDRRAGTRHAFIEKIAQQDSVALS